MIPIESSSQKELIIPSITIFQKFTCLSIQHGAQTHSFKIKNHKLIQLSSPSALLFSKIILTVRVMVSCSWLFCLFVFYLGIFVFVVMVVVFYILFWLFLLKVDGSHLPLYATFTSLYHFGAQSKVPNKY